MERQPAEPRDREAQRAGHVGGSREHRQAGGLELFDVGTAIGQAAGNAAAEEDDVGGFAMSDGLGMFAFSFGGFGFFLLLDALALCVVRGNGGAGLGIGQGSVAADLEHLVADLVDLDELFGFEQAVGDQRAIDEQRAFVAGGRDRVEPAPPGVRADRCRRLRAAASASVDEIGANCEASRLSRFSCGGEGADLV